VSNLKPVLRLLSGVALTTVLSLHYDGALAQAPAESDESGRGDSRAEVTTVVVTGTRITSRGFSAPTPTTIVNSEDIAKTAQPNIFTAVTELPSLQGSTGTNTGTFSTSSGQQGLSSFSLRGLGTIRTLTLLDGQRVVGANVTGVPDISQFPQLLIKRVDVVTGGASASYGSDAVGGVVNFITEKHLEGVKGVLQGGITTYGDDGQFLVGAAAGTALLDHRLHLEGSVEYDHENGVKPGGFGEGLAGGRDWFQATTLLNTGQLNNGFPQYVYTNHAQSTTYSKWGLITSGPLKNIAFDAAGGHGPFALGSPCYTGFCAGGDNSAAVGAGATLVSSVERTVGYGRIGWSLNDDNEVYADFNIANVESRNQPNPGAFRSGLSIPCTNPYLPADIAATACGTGTTFSYGLDNAFLPNPHVEPKREQQRYVIGAEGKITVGSDWRYDAYYEHAMNTTNIHVFDIPLQPHYNNAINATTVNGQIVCANAAARSAGCVPVNIFGGNVALTPEQLDYIDPSPGPFQHTHQTEDAASLAINGEPFSLWAGPVSVAFGGEWRKEYYRVIGDPYGNGVTDQSPNSDLYPADPVVSPAGANWYAGNYHDGSGQYNVKEAFLETNLPFLDSETFGKANLNTAGRWTDYSTSGTVYTWKIGGAWVTPYSPLRVRGVVSRDVRAPNLSELFAAPTTTTTPGITIPLQPGQTQQAPPITVLQNTIGNPNLKPEVAKNYEAGIVLTNPAGLEGFSASVDYYYIEIKDIISTLSAQQQVNFCKDPNTPILSYCETLDLAPANGSQAFVNVQSFNLASVITKGMDFEASYQMPLDRIHAPGNLTVRALATHVIGFTAYSGIKGVPNVELAGQNSGGSGTFGNTPYWKLYGVQSWDWKSLGLDVTERWFGSGVIGHQYVECQSGCPASTTNNPTISNNHMPGAFYLDLGARYSITDGITAFVKVDNVFNKDPAAAPQTNTGLDVNPALYDTIGRIYRAGFRFNF
jgi:iron complex outermembrane receptor protein